MIAAIANLRALVLLRRIARALESLRDLEQERLGIEQSRYGRDYPERFKPQRGEASVASVERWNELASEKARAESAGGIVGEDDLWP